MSPHVGHTFKHVTFRANPRRRESRMTMVVTAIEDGNVHFDYNTGEVGTGGWYLPLEDWLATYGRTLPYIEKEAL